jgi:opacity protein-like surface antigen
VKRKVILWMMALAVLCAVTASAADINGKWTASVPGRDGTPMEQTYVFKVAGDKVTGTITTQMGETTISDGTLTGDAISFVTVMERNGNTIKMLYKGTVAGNEMTLTRSREGAAAGGGGGGGRGGPQKLTLKKAS